MSSNAQPLQGKLSIFFPKASYRLPSRATQFERSAAMRVAFVAVMGCLLASVATAQTATDPTCEYRAMRKVSFASSKSDDLLTIGIGSGSCHSATLTITVVSASGETLYRYSAPFKRHTVVQWDDPNLVSVAMRFVDDTLWNAVVSHQDLPKAVRRTKGNFFDLDGDELKISEPRFKRLLAMRQPILFHSTHYEAYQYIAYDPKAGRAMVIIDGGY